jgi:hypothetical protein
MPFFFIVPLWIVCIVAGVAFLFSARFRFLSIYILLGSTAGLFLSFLLSLLFLFVAAKLVGGTPVAWIALLAYLAGIPIGGAVGIIGGAILARKINRRLGWH